MSRQTTCRGNDQRDGPHEQALIVPVAWLQLPKDLWKCILELQTQSHRQSTALNWRMACKAWNNIFKEFETQYVERRQRGDIASIFEFAPLLGPTNPKLINTKINLGRRECGKKIFFRIWLMWTYFSFDPRQPLLPHSTVPLLVEHEPERFELLRSGGSCYEATSDEHSLLIRKSLANFVEIKIEMLESSPFRRLFAHKKQVNNSGLFTVRLNRDDLLGSVGKTLFFRMLFRHLIIRDK